MIIDDQQLLKKDCDKLAAFEVSREDFLLESEMQVSTTKDTRANGSTKVQTKKRVTKPPKSTPKTNREQQILSACKKAQNMFGDGRSRKRRRSLSPEETRHLQTSPSKKTAIRDDSCRVDRSPSFSPTWKRRYSPSPDNPRTSSSKKRSTGCFEVANCSPSLSPKSWKRRHSLSPEGSKHYLSPKRSKDSLSKNRSRHYSSIDLSRQSSSPLRSWQSLSPKKRSPSPKKSRHLIDTSDESTKKLRQQIEQLEKKLQLCKYV